MRASKHPGYCLGGAIHKQHEIAASGAVQEIRLQLQADSDVGDVEITASISSDRIDFIQGNNSISTRVAVRDAVFVRNADAAGETITIQGNTANLIGNFGNDSLVGGSDNDLLDGAAGDDTLIGSDGNDTLLGGSANDRLEGGADRDDLFGGIGSDTMIGGDGSDRYFVDNAGDRVFESRNWSGRDEVRTTISFSAGNQHIENISLLGLANINAIGNGLSNVLRGNVSDNLLKGGTNRDTLIGGLGADQYWIENTGDVVIENVGEGTDTIHSSLLSTLLADNVENLVLLGSTDSSGTGNALGNHIRGNAGTNTLNGGSGDDTLDGGTGNDLLIGGQGSDVIYVDNIGDRVAESRKWAGHDTVISSVDFRTGNKHIEDLELTGTARIGAGNGLMNRITGNDADNILDGGKNVDTLIGGLGNDIYLIRSPGDSAIEAYGEGIDAVKAYRSYSLEAHIEKLFMQNVFTKAGLPTNLNAIGNGLDNTIIRTPYDNTIVGREGSDILKGQAGDDTFVFDRALGANNVDRIIDFEVNGDNDTLKIKASLLGGGMSAGVLAAADFATGTAAGDASDRFIFDQASGRLWFDADGTGALAQQLMAAFEQNALVAADDILLF